VDNETIGRKLRDIRKKRGMTLMELARHVGITFSQISRLELGQQSFRTQTLARITAALGVKPSHVFVEEDAGAVAEASPPCGLAAGGDLRAAMKSRKFFRVVERLAHVFFDRREAFLIIKASVKAIRDVHRERPLSQ